MNWLVLLASRALEVNEREIVIGDLIEFEESGWRAFRDVVGIVLRRQLQVWTAWPPWVALFGVAGVSGFCLGVLLSTVDRSIGLQLRAWQKYGIPYNTGVTSLRDQLIYVSVQAAAIACWTAVNSSLLRRLSGRAGWLTSLLFYLVVLDSLPLRRLMWGSGGYYGTTHWGRAVSWVLPLNLLPVCLIVLLFLVPAIVGTLARLPGLVPLALIFTIGAAALGEIRAHDLETFSHGMFPAPPWPSLVALYVLASWPCLVKLRFH